MNNTTKQLLIYTAFLSMTWMLYVIFVSSTTFMHFILGHKIKVIEVWTIEKGWMLVLSAKFICFLFFVKFVEIYHQRQKSFNFFLKRSFEMINVHSILFNFMILIFLILAMQVQGATISYEQDLASFVGIICYIFIDIILLYFLEMTWRTTGSIVLLKYFIILVLYHALTRIFFPTTEQGLFYLIFHFFIALIFFRSLMECILYLCCVPGPLSYIFHQNFFLREDILEKSLIEKFFLNSHFILLLGIILIYKFYNKKNLKRSYDGQYRF